MKKTNTFSISIKAAIAIIVCIALIMPGIAAVSSIFNETSTTTSDDNQPYAPLDETIIYVDDDNTAGPWDGTQVNPFQYIQDGVNAAHDGDTVFVFSGEYHESIRIETRINLTGEDKHTTIINGDATGNVIIIVAPYSLVEGFTMTNAGTGVTFGYGIKVEADNVIINNNIVAEDNYIAISISNCVSAIITNNIISYNEVGIYTWNTINNNITDNTFLNNNYIGLFLAMTFGNHIYHNNFINNTNQALDNDDDIDIWDDGYPSGGNYWDDYSGVDQFSGPNQDQPGSDGIGDTRYLIGGSINEFDNYPLMAPWLPAIVDSIIITGAPDGAEIGSLTVGPDFIRVGYASAYDYEGTYIGIIDVTWAVDNSGTNAFTSPSFGSSSTFNSGNQGGMATWTADDGIGHTDIVMFEVVVPPTVDQIKITDSPDGAEIGSLTVGGDFTITGYASSYNATVGYLGTVTVSWSVDNPSGTTAFTNPSTGMSSTFNSGTSSGFATWIADDGNGHVDTVIFEILADSEAPVTAVQLTGTIGENNWYTSTVSIQLSAIDDTAVDFTMYKVNDNVWNVYSSPIDVVIEGYHTIYYYSVDTEGNSEIPKSTDFKMDLYAPSISQIQEVDSDPQDTEPGFGWKNISCTVTDFSSVDSVTLKVIKPDLSAIDIIMTNQPATDIFYNNTTFSELGFYTYTIESDDDAGLVSSSGSNSFYVYPNWDINMDNLTNILDLVQVSIDYGVTGEFPGWIRADVDNDGEIKILDLVQVSLHYNEQQEKSQSDGQEQSQPVIPQNIEKVTYGSSQPLGSPLGTTIVSISPSSQTVGPGETFTVDVYVEPGDPINAVSFDSLTFDPTVIQAVSVEENDLFDPYTTWFNGGTIDNVAGEITDVYGLTLPATNTVTSPGIFCTINFMALSVTDTSDLSLLGVIVSDINGQAATISVNDGSVQVDADSPVTTDVSSSTGTTGDNYAFVATVSDNIDPAGDLTVTVDWSHGGLNDITTMAFIGGTTFQAVVALDHSVSDLSYSISAEDLSGNINTLPTSYVTISDNDVPIITGITGDTTGQPGESTTITATFSDNIGITTATIYYRPASGGWSSKSILSGSADISIPIDNDEDWYYYITINDAAGNGPIGDPSTDGSVYYTIQVTDTVAPIITGVSASVAVGTGNSVTLWVSGTDNIGVTNARVFIDGDPTGILMSFNGGMSRWEYVYNAPVGDDSDHTYSVTIYDDATLSDSSGPHSITVTDIIAPIISSVSNNVALGTGDSVTLWVSGTDNIGVTSARVFIDGDPTGILMAFNGGMSRWEYVYNAPVGDDSDHTYSVTIYDDATLSDSSISYNIIVTDTIAPSIDSITGDTTGNTGETTTITTTFSDNIGVTSALIYYRSASSGWVSADISSGSFGISIPSDNDEDWYYYIVINDAADNGPIGDPSTDGSTYYTISVSDNDAPMLSNDLSSSVGSTGEPISFSVDASDNIGISHVYVYWKKVGGVYTQQEMSGSGTYTYGMTVDLNDNANIQYYFEAEDTSSTTTQMYSPGSPATIIISDNDDPVISSVILTNSAPMDTNPSFGWTTIEATITDNVGIEEVYLKLTNPDSTDADILMTNIPSTDTFYYNTTYTDIGTYSYYIYTDDTSGNIDFSGSDTFIIYPNWDINMDWECDILDLVQVSLVYGDTGPYPGWIRADVDNDGEVKILDLVQVSLHYNEVFPTSGSGEEPGDGGPTADTVVSIQPPNQNVALGETFFVDVHIAPGEPINAVSFDTLEYDPSLIQAVEVTEGDLFATAPNTLFNPGAIDNTAGTITNVYNLIFPATYTVETPGILCTIEFIAQQSAGTSPLNLDSIIVSDAVGGPAPFVVNNGSVNVDDVPPEVDYILITESPNGPEITGEAIGPGFSKTGYASAYNTSSGYMGLLSVSWSVQNTDSTAYSNPATGTSSTFNIGTDTGIGVWTADDGNGHVDTVSYSIDLTVPETTPLLIGATGDNDYYIGPVEITLTATDSSGIDFTEYQLDEGSWQTYSGPLTVDVDGNHLLSYYSVDNLGNIEPADISLEFDIDQEDPVISDVQADPETQDHGGLVDISCIVIDNILADEVKVDITGPEGFTPVNTTMTKEPGADNYDYEVNYYVSGTYNFLIWTKDEAGHDTKSGQYQFEILEQPLPVDYIVITDDPDGTEIPDQSVEVNFTIMGYASAYNDTSGYLGLISVSWSVENTDSNATTDPISGTESTFNASSQNGTALWMADDGNGHTDTVSFEISPEQIGPELDFVLPEMNNLYICSILFYRGGFNITTVIGYVTITVEATDETGIDRVEFSLDDGSTYTDNNTNNSIFSWDLVSWRIGEYVLTATAYDNENISTTKTMDLRLICFGFFDNESNMTNPLFARMARLNRDTTKPVIEQEKHTIDPISPPPEEPDDPIPTFEQVHETRQNTISSMIEKLQQARYNRLSGSELLQQLRNLMQQRFQE